MILKAYLCIRENYFNLLMTKCMIISASVDKRILKITNDYQ